METKSMTRKDFFVLTFSLVGTAVVASNCGSSNGGGGGTGGSATGTGGKGTGGSTTGTGGATGTGGRGMGGAPADGGSGTGGATGTGGRADGGGDTGPGDVPVTPDSGPADTGTNCTLPLPNEQQVIVTGTGGDTNNHFHSVTVNATILNSTTDQTFDTGTGAANNHTHMVTLTAVQLGMLRGGGTVTIRSTNFGAVDGGAAGHTHSYLVSCHPIPDAGADSSPG